MDPTLLNRIGIAFEFFGAAFAAPEVVDRLVGLQRFEEFLENLLSRLGNFARRFLATRETRRMSGGIIIVGLVDYTAAIAIILTLTRGSGNAMDLGWWWPWRLLAAWPALIIPVMLAFVAVWWVFNSVRDALRRGGALRAIGALVGVSLLACVVIALFVPYLLIMSPTPLLVVVESIVKRLRQGWLSRALLVVGLTSIVTGLGLQFAATF